MAKMRIRSHSPLPLKCVRLSQILMLLPCQVPASKRLPSHLSSCQYLQLQFWPYELFQEWSFYKYPPHALQVVRGGIWAYLAPPVISFPHILHLSFCRFCGSTGSAYSQNGSKFFGMLVTLNLQNKNKNVFSIFLLQKIANQTNNQQVKMKINLHCVSNCPQFPSLLKVRQNHKLKLQTLKWGFF